MDAEIGQGERHATCLALEASTYAHGHSTGKTMKSKENELLTTNKLCNESEARNNMNLEFYTENRQKIIDFKSNSNTYRELHKKGPSINYVTCNNFLNGGRRGPNF